jgi:flagellar motor switch protein FliM
MRPGEGAEEGNEAENGSVSEILSESEINSLLRSLPDEGAGEAAQAPAGSPKRIGVPGAERRRTRSGAAFEPYDFRRPDKFSKDQLRTLQMVHETFARLAGSSLSAHLRTSVSLDLISLEQVPYEEYLRSISSSVFTIVSLQPLNGQAVLEVEFALVFAIIDRLLGGPGKAVQRSNLTEIERPLVETTIDRMFAALKAAWEGVVDVNPVVDGIETSSQFVQVAPPGDIVVTILFEVKVGNQRGAMSLCIPYLLLKPITTKLSAQKWFASGVKKANPQFRSQLAAQVEHTRVDCSVVLGEAKISARELVSLKAGDIVRLEQKTNEPILFRVANVAKLVGSPALQAKKLVFTVHGPLQD